MSALEPTDPSGRAEPVIVDSAPDPRARWVRVKAAFLAAVDLPLDQRHRFLAQECGNDPSVEAEVRALLEVSEKAGSFCESPAASVLALATAGPARPHLAPGTRLGHYVVTEFLSAGGMGEVYRARDSLLGRDVAIKTVAGNSRPDCAEAARRLLREARHASTLDHPNICTIHDVGDEGGTPYIVMALIDGAPLRDILNRERLPLPLVLEYGTQVAAALAHAHHRGIVHRDLKGANVMVDATGRAIVLDFGLARRLPAHLCAAEADASITVAGALAGTPSHMAPEVLQGGAADTRSDVWSLGVLLYQLATGALPFTGRTPFATTAAILNEPPAPFPVGVPLSLRLVIDRCLARDPEARYASAADVLRALSRIRRRGLWQVDGLLTLARRRRTLVVAATAGVLSLGALAAAPHVWRQVLATPGAVSTLAILPLEESPDGEHAYYAAGLTEALVARLGEAVDVRVIATGSASRLAGESGGQPDGALALEAARHIGADAVLTGRFRHAGARVAVDLRLLDTRRGSVLWSDSFERPAGHVLALQADVVEALADGVRLVLRPARNGAARAARAVNPEAYEAFLKGRFEWNRRTAESLQLAIAHFTRSIDLDPTYAPAHAALADCYNQLGTVMVGAGSPRDYRPRAIEAAIRALQIDPQSAEAHAALAYARHYDWHWEAAEEGFRRSIELNPSYALARLWYANLLMSQSRFDEALEQVQVARELDPFSLVVNTNVGWVLSFARRYDEAISQLEHTLALDSTYPQARMRRIDVLLMAGRGDEAVREARRLVDDSPGWTPALATLAGAHARGGSADSARVLLRQLLARSRTEHVSSAAIAGIFNHLGETDSALAWYARVFDERSNASVYIDIDPGTGPAARDPRFLALLEAAGVRAHVR